MLQLAESNLLSEFAAMLSCYASSQVLVDHATAVCSAARQRDHAAVRRAVRRLLGAGKGLTPSGDDALCAVFLVLGGVGDRAAISLLGEAVQDQWTSTTSLSAPLLDAARTGYAVPDAVTLVELALRGDRPGARSCLMSTLRIGHLSGADMVAGLAGALRVLADAHSPIPAR